MKWLAVRGRGPQCLFAFTLMRLLTWSTITSLQPNWADVYWISYNVGVIWLKCQA